MFLVWTIFSGESVASATALDNLQTAYNGECNASARYLAFAKKAEAEDYGEEATLFRAAARAEQVHAETAFGRPVRIYHLRLKNQSGD